MGGDAALEETGAVIDRIAQAETAAVKAAAELPADRRILVVDEVRAAGSADAVHRVLYDVAAWPGLLAHVERAEVLQDEDGAQLVEVDTREADGGILAMRTAWVGRGGTLVAYKQLVLPPIGSSHTVRWRVEPDGDGATVRSEQVVVLAPDVADVAAVTSLRVQGVEREGVPGPRPCEGDRRGARPAPLTRVGGRVRTSSWAVGLRYPPVPRRATAPAVRQSTSSTSLPRP
ncbi:hypothetical protein [Streptomyces rubradiris]|uniref:Polyketide cyclase / dehydrase and lipid transport n=1 Tax=Streptomyces rubradiris TaxID=285531 RepID=A0ABQ3RER3_STRRR|nr:hypothetical protein [Streptomyces rubradiris]GHG98048.1 hypothetical protein GCM10018792_10480 [Streptomyces rubradiris]GHI54333.1 hypothetical protein Srubr_41790 [Streptomyces rubradiris]